MNAQRLIWWIILTCLLRGLAAQPRVDSILRAYGYPVADTEAVLGLYDAAYELEISEPQTALKLYQKGVAWSRDIDYADGIGKGYNYNGIVWFNLGQIDSAIFYARASLPWLEKAGNQLGYAASLNNIGNGYNVLNNFPEAIRYYQQANAVYESLGEPVNIISNLNNIGNMLVRSGNYDQGERYLLDALDRARRIGFVAGLADANNNLGSLQEARKQYDRALPYFRDALKYYQELGEANFIIQSLSNVGWCYHTLGNDEQATARLGQAMLMLDTLDLPREQVNVLTNLSVIYNSRGDYQKAIQLELEALPAAHELGDLVFEKRLVEAMVRTYEGLGDLVAVATYNRRLLELTQQLFDAEKNRQLLDLERKYESEKKERRILEQELELQQKTAQNRLVLLLSGLLAVLALLAILWLRSRLQFNKRLSAQQTELQTQRLRELEQEKKLAAMDAMISGQEKERNRIARDLHDGLGGLLASVKMHFAALQRDSPSTGADPVGAKTSKLIDQAAQEVRRIAHDMMPGALMEHGLLPAIEELAEGLRRTRGMQVIVQAIGKLDDHMPENQEMMIYRIVQELLQNITRHTKATKVIIQLHRHDSELSLLVEDNGQGFDPASVKDGLGLKSIASRVEYLKGALDIDSVPGEGTTVVINLPFPEIFS